jgi:hypothetical protein
MDTLHAVSQFVLDSDGYTHVNFTIYKDEETATKAYKSLSSTLAYKIAKVIDYEPSSEEQEELGSECYIVKDAEGLSGNCDVVSSYEDGNFKRPRGYQLLKIPIATDSPDGVLCLVPILAYPNNKTYKE